MLDGRIRTENGKFICLGQRPDAGNIHIQQRQRLRHLFRDGGKADGDGDPVIMEGRKLGLMCVFMQRTKGKVPGGHIAVLALPKQALASTFLAVIDLHNVRSQLLMLVAVGHLPTPVS